MLVPNVEPYGHTVRWDDGSTHTYTTLERPNLHFDGSGQLTHINLAADLDTGDEGCPDRKDHCPAFHVHCAGSAGHLFASKLVQVCSCLHCILPHCCRMSVCVTVHFWGVSMRNLPCREPWAVT